MGILFLSLAFGATVLLVDVGDLGHQPLSLTHIRASAGVLGVEVLAPFFISLTLGFLPAFFIEIAMAACCAGDLAMVYEFKLGSLYGTRVRLVVSFIRKYLPRSSIQ